MEDTFSCTTSGRNIYMINREKKHLFLTHPSLVPHLHPKYTGQVDTADYYARKASYLKEHGYLDGLGHQYDGVITADMVKEELANLKQLVFEVTDACNLRCKYCGYGELYGNFDERRKKMMGFESAKRIIDFLQEIWAESRQRFTNKVLFISFYGGEPLMNMPFIRQVVDYIESLDIKNRKIQYSMTTNAMLLDQCMDYLAEKKFNLLISLDGNEWNNSYRVTPGGENSFRKNVAHVDLLREKYPEYFDTYVNFNAVLHNRNTVDEIFHFIKDRYGKKPHVAPLNTTGIREDKKEEFEKMYRNKVADLEQSEDYEVLVDEMFMDVPAYSEACIFIHQYNGNVYQSYNDLFGKQISHNFIPTGGCIPFARKMFVTVNGKILACERIGQQYGLGTIEADHSIRLSCEEIARLYNQYYDKLRAQCRVCYRSQSCTRCIFTIDRLYALEKVRCPSFEGKEAFAAYVSRNLSFLEEHPKAYERIMEVVLA